MWWSRRRRNGASRSARVEEFGPASAETRSCFVVGAEYYAPELVVHSEEIERRAGLLGLGLRPGTLEEGTGVKARRFCSDSEHPSTLAATASQRLLERLGMAREDVEALLFAANTMDETEPITGMRVHESLRLKGGVFVADIRDACNSALKAMMLATGMIRSGMVSNVLVAVGERLHDGIFLNIRSKRDLVSRYLAGLTLGDAGAAVLLSSKRTARCFEVVHQTWEVDSSKRELARIEAGGTRCLTDPEKIYFISNAKKLCQVAVERLPSMIRRVCGELGWDLASIGVIPHQVSKGVITTIAKVSGLPLNNVMITVDRFGNTGSATIPMALAMAFQNGFSHAFRRILLVGGAAGFSAAILALEVSSYLDSLGKQLEELSKRLKEGIAPAGAAAQTSL